MNLGGKKNYIFVSTVLKLKFPIPFSYECEQHTTLVLAELSPHHQIEIRAIFISPPVDTDVSKYHTYHNFKIMVVTIPISRSYC